MCLMTDQELLTRIEQLAGPQRNRSFRIAAEWVLAHPGPLIETGCYRGIPQDGQSTVILALLAQHIGIVALSYDIRDDHISQAQALLRDQHLEQFVTFIHGDSIDTLAHRKTHIRFAYLDSYDFEANDPEPSQRHQLKEAQLVVDLVDKPAAILLDDCDLPHGGKAGMSGPFLESHGWKLVYSAYQRLYVIG